RVDKLLLGGAMIFTFYKAQGLEIGNSKHEDDFIELAKEILAEAGDRIVLPKDIVVAEEISEDAASKTVSYDAIPQGWIGLDIGPASIAEFKEIVSSAKTVVWNGPLGLFEIEKFAKGTVEIAKVLAETNAKSIVGGGDSAAALEKFHLADKVFHVSTGGGASLQFLEGTPLPGLVALEQN
ncbi:phosphoglycerate kinase, partial [Candidatus Woesearchaeota archaeon]